MNILCHELEREFCERWKKSTEKVPSGVVTNLFQEQFVLSRLFHIIPPFQNLQVNFSVDSLDFPF